MRAGLGLALIAQIAPVMLAGGAGAQSLDRSLLGNGGRLMSGGGQVMIGTVGQPVVGQSAGGGGSGYVTCHGWWCIEGGALVAVEDPERDEPGFTGFDRPRPNPSRGAVLLSFRLAREGRVEVVLHDVTGARVATPVSGVLPPGRHEARWDGCGPRGRHSRPGVYFVTFATEGSVIERRRIVLLR